MNWVENAFILVGPCALVPILEELFPELDTARAAQCVPSDSQMMPDVEVKVMP